MNKGIILPIVAGLFLVGAVGCAAVATMGIAVVALAAGAVAGGAAWVGLGFIEQIAQGAAGAVGLDDQAGAAGNLLLIDGEYEVIK